MRQKRWGSEENPFVLGLYPAIEGDREDVLLSSKGCSSHLVCDTLRPSPKKINKGKKLHKDRSSTTFLPLNCQRQIDI